MRSEVRGPLAQPILLPLPSPVKGAPRRCAMAQAPPLTGPGPGKVKRLSGGRGGNRGKSRR